MITFPLYSLVADVMARLGIQPISQAEILANRRTNFQGRRKTDGLGSFLLDHLILDAIQILVLTLLYSLFFS
jgi:hypothetical protein